MATPGKEGPNTVSLDGLLNSLGGVEGSILSRPKSMNTMKHSMNHTVVDTMRVSEENVSTEVLVVGQEEQGVHHFDVEDLLSHEEQGGENQCTGTKDVFETISLNDSGADDLLQGVYFASEDVGILNDQEGGEDVPRDPQPEREGRVETTQRNSLPVFDCLDEKMAKYPAVENPLGVHEGGVEDHPAESHDHATVSEIGHKAAKALQMGKKWLFNTSKNIARDVQSRIDARASRRKHRRQRSIIDYPMSDFVPEEHHRLWAEQLKDVPPETQVAALEAMEDYDRLAVQQVIDEMIWYDKHSATREGREESQEDKNSPIDSDISPQQDVEQASAAVEETFDLLNLDSNPDHGCVQGDADWEDTLFGSSASKPSTKPVQEPQIVGDEPEIRRKLRDQRLAREQQRVDEQVANMRDAEARETSEKEEKVIIRSRIRPEIDAWCAGKKDNIRSLLCTMDKVMWEGSRWKSPSVADVIEPPSVRKWYMKANLVVHPDKVKQSHGALEQLVRAEMIFDVLQHAWAKFS